MREHFVLVVDNLIEERSIESSSNERPWNRFDYTESETESVSESKSLFECRICHDEDIDSNMEIPCFCSGSLKYAHRKCIQRWCNAKGNTNCEICLEQFGPSYTSSPPLFRYGNSPMNFRGNWEISRHNQDNSHVVRIRRVPSDYFSNSNCRHLVYFWCSALIILTLLVLRHALPLIISGKVPFSINIFIIILMRILGILVPVYAIGYALYLLNRLHCCFRSHQVPVLPYTIPDSESDNSSFGDDEDDDDEL